MGNNKHVMVGDVKIGNDLPFVLIAGPDSLESLDRALFFASFMKKACDNAGIQYIFKASYDKANRTSVDSFRGVGIEAGMEIFKKIKQEIKVPVTTDVHSAEDAQIVGGVVDLVQVPALLSRQTDIIVASARTGKPINIKKGQFVAPQNIDSVIGKSLSVGNENVLLTERGYMFGYNNLVVDMRALEIMKQTGYPVIFDASHSVQLPSAGQGISSGDRQFIFPLARAAVAVGVAGIFVEVYDDPKKAPVDADNAFLLDDVDGFLRTLKKIDMDIKEK